MLAGLSGEEFGYPLRMISKTIKNEYNKKLTPFIKGLLVQFE